MGIGGVVCKGLQWWRSEFASREKLVKGLEEAFSD